MKKILFILSTCIATLSHAQNMEISWSPNIEYDRMTTGDLSKFAGANEKYVYGMFSPTYKKMATNSRTLIVYDKISMKPVGKLNLTSSADFKDICVTNDAIYVLSIDDSKGKEVLYAQTYTPTLEVIAAKKKIYQINTNSSAASRFYNSIKTMVNSKANSNLYIVAEKPNTKNEQVQIEYNVVDKDLNTLSAAQIELPVVSVRNTAATLSSFTVGDDGMILSKNYIKTDRETRKEEKLFSYAILSVINPEKQTINSLPIKATGKHINDFEYFSRDGKLYVAGIYSENQGKLSERGNGVFFSVLNTVSGELENTKFSEINGAKVRFGILYLEKIKQNADGSITLFATEDQNIVITTQTKNGTTTRYENIKGNILVVNLHKDGSLNWKNVVPRSITYDQLYVRDIQVMLSEENSYLTYADRFRSGKKNFFNRRSKKEMRDLLPYSQFNTASGSMQTQNFKLNKENTEKNDRRFMNAANLTEINNVLYLDGFQVHIKPGVAALGCVTAPLCGFGCGYWYIKLNNGSAVDGGGSLGSIRLNEK
jgi:hypothetical protein